MVTKIVMVLQLFGMTSSGRMNKRRGVVSPYAFSVEVRGGNNAQYCIL
jgi:hypothetical protein